MLVKTWMKKATVNLVAQPFILILKGFNLVMGFVWSWALFLIWIGCGGGFIANLICWLTKTQTFAHFCLLTLLLAIVFVLSYVLSVLFNSLGEITEFLSEKLWDYNIKLDHIMNTKELEMKNERLAKKANKKAQREAQKNTKGNIISDINSQQRYSP